MYAPILTNTVLLVRHLHIGIGIVFLVFPIDPSHSTEYNPIVDTYTLTLERRKAELTARLRDTLRSGSRSAWLTISKQLEDLKRESDTFGQQLPRLRSIRQS